MLSGRMGRIVASAQVELDWMTDRVIREIADNNRKLNSHGVTYDTKTRSVCVDVRQFMRYAGSKFLPTFPVYVETHLDESGNVIERCEKYLNDQVDRIPAEKE